ncbi:hypothetical protein LOT_1420 [Lentilactobacillus otakiensis DSM 19908 = JCM 15040]|uniref:Uncharacterized protein n=1 Tax=Lentilactobacillus otakiensis DSM 19908 = JCM 15040 TaxID=1423780 RepID=S4NI40_9LACO|nr:hypothetical protein LOT_1420 [Lentilactobacillus otakiensis DSM 19908 = JCM 15040]
MLHVLMLYAVIIFAIATYLKAVAWVIFAIADIIRAIEKNRF